MLLNPAASTVLILGARGRFGRAAVHAFGRAQRGNKGFPAPCDGKLMVLMIDGRSVRGVDANGIQFRL